MIKQRINPPQNWQDFEELCLRLWGEIWNVRDEIEFNSNNSSGQDGVDICCIPKNKKAYYGIQCKNKSLYFKNGKPNKLTKIIIEKEIEKAKKFKPKLQYLIIATSCPKDKKIEEYIREINIINIEKKLFKIQICFWDYISRKILEIEPVYKWYCANEHFNKTKSVSVTFEDGLKKKTFEPEFIKSIVYYRLQTHEEKNEEIKLISDALTKLSRGKEESRFEKFLSIFKRGGLKIDDLGKATILIDGKDITSQEYIESTYPRPKIDKNTKISFPDFNKIPNRKPFIFQIKIFNDGDIVIDDFKLNFKIHGNFDSAEVISPTISENSHYRASTWINKDNGLIQPNDNFIVQQDSFLSKKIFIYPNKSKAEVIEIRWELLARDFNDSGILKINIIPKYIETTSTMYVLKETDCRTDYEFHYKMKKGHLTLNI